MPFDGTEFRPEQYPSRSPGHDTAAAVIVVVLAVSLLVFPISLGALVDIVAYLRRP